MLEALKALTEAFDETEKAPALGKGTDKHTLYSLMITECRLLYCNAPLVRWVETEYGSIWERIHIDLQKKTEDQ